MVRLVWISVNPGQPSTFGSVAVQTTLHCAVVTASYTNIIRASGLCRTGDSIRCRLGFTLQMPQHPVKNGEARSRDRPILSVNIIHQHLNKNGIWQANISYRLPSLGVNLDWQDVNGIS
ncbi:hypothetical protein [Oculatella sp. LEGE 06141]|uniref:hypothetical protein n=1 Tax=Oculatella sp. LEGE 06141 TaxID=1828648 RepID=UPI0030D9B2FC